jgi:hypothetical protein
MSFTAYKITPNIPSSSSVFIRSFRPIPSRPSRYFYGSGLNHQILDSLANLHAITEPSKRGDLVYRPFSIIAVSKHKRSLKLGYPTFISSGKRQRRRLKIHLLWLIVGCGDNRIAGCNTSLAFLRVWRRKSRTRSDAAFACSITFRN